MGGDKTMTERTVMQFEPLEQDRCKPGTPNRALLRSDVNA